MAVHKLDLIIADRAMPSHLSVRLQPFAGRKRAGCIRRAGVGSRVERAFPECLNKQPLLPGEDFAVHARLMQWLHTQVARLQ
jgi:LysR family transcriptional activator of nhaA